MSIGIEVINLMVKFAYGKQGVHIEKTPISIEINTEHTTVTKKDIQTLLWFSGILGIISTSMDEEEIKYFIKPKKNHH